MNSEFGIKDGYEPNFSTFEGIRSKNDRCRNIYKENGSPAGKASGGGLRCY
ncbi:hypothetical protein R83H12_00492 [Fibrobacteria bacterium R8-3-H12]